MRRLTVLFVLLAAAAPASAQLPSGIARPANESALSPIELGAALYAGNCVTCHGIAGRGIYRRGPRGGAGDVHGLGPSLKDAGAQAADFYLRTGYMPLGRPDEQPKRGRVHFDERELRGLIAYVASLGDGPAVPQPHPERGSAYGSIYFGMLALHHLHVVVGILLSGVLLAKLAGGLTSYRVTGLRAIALYWCFVAGLAVPVVLTQVSPSL